MLTELRLRRAAQPMTERWRHVPVPPRGAVPLGISYRPLQAEALGLDPGAALAELLRYPFELIRIAAYWNRLEPRPGAREFGEFDQVLDAAERAGKRIIVGLGPVKNFGYPEFFVPGHHLDRPLPEGRLITPRTHPRLLEAGTGFAASLVRRYRDREAITAWQVEHEAADPLGMEHSWRLSEAFIAAEVAAVRDADPGRPVLMNGFLPTSTPVALQQRWRTRDQGDSLAVALRLADIVGADVYPRHAVAAAGPFSAYLDGGGTRSGRRRRERLLGQVARAGRRLMIAEGQAEPWEAVTTPPNPAGRAMSSCRPEDLIGNYRAVLEWAAGSRGVMDGYLFWGAEYWLARERDGDPGYLRAFERVLGGSADAALSGCARGNRTAPPRPP